MRVCVVCVRLAPNPPPCVIVVFLLTYLCVCVSLPSTCVCMEGFCFPRYCCISFNIVCARVCVCVRLAPTPPPCVIVVSLLTYLCVCVSLPRTCVCMEGFCFPRYCCISFNIVCARVCVCVRLAPNPPRVLLLYFF